MSTLSNDVYLDHAAATPLDADIFASIKKYLSDEFYNPSAAYLVAKKVRQDIDSARKKISQILGCKPAEIIFTAGATEANNLVVNGLIHGNEESEIVASALEHEALFGPAEKHRLRVAKVDQKGRLDILDLLKKINDKTLLVSVIYASNEIGTIQNLAEIATIINKERGRRKASDNQRPIYFHTDASQASNYLNLDVNRLGVDLMTINGAKTYGPKQSACLYVNRNVGLQPLIIGGEQESGLRGGTENPFSCVGLALALDKAQSARSAECKRLDDLKDILIGGLTKISSDIKMHGNLKKQLPNIVSFSVPGADGERMVMELDEKGVRVATGAACSANKNSRSRSLQSIGLTDNEIDSTLRISLGRSTTEDDINYALEHIKGIIKRL